SALGFSLGSSLARFWPLLAGPLVASGSSVDWALRLTRAGLLVAQVNASTTALVTAAIWLRRYDRRRAGRPVQSSILVVPTVAFCPSCGAARTASSKRARSTVRGAV